VSQTDQESVQSDMVNRRMHDTNTTHPTPTIRNTQCVSWVALRGGEDISKP